ncbi:MAG TPA: hypothetical protein VFB78_17835 [Acidimicrobiales bacterium]|nr:hypothetical protein [Acidimicrobiales bacterium]
MADAPWSLRGEAMFAWCGSRQIVVAERYETSPVGPYVALGVARVTRLGARLGLCFTTMVVDNHDRLADGRRNWGFPGEIGTLTWANVADESVLVWHERGIEVRGLARGRVFPLVAPSRFLQHRADGPVVVPVRMTGRARRARVEVRAPADDELYALRGEHRGLVVRGLATRLHVARVPAGRLWSARAPAGAPESAMVQRTVAARAASPTTKCAAATGGLHR